MGGREAGREGAQLPLARGGESEEGGREGRQTGGRRRRRRAAAAAAAAATEELTKRGKINRPIITRFATGVARPVD